ncbi:MAG: hypothetical protein STHCBS139747_007114 [Sporothrix thermara]
MISDSDSTLRRPFTSTGPRLQSARRHETLNLQVSLWPTFQPAKLPEIRDPGRPKVHNGRRSVSRSSRRKGKGGRAREVDVLEQVLEDEGRLRMAASKAKRQAEWQRMWQNLQQLGEAVANVSSSPDDMPMSRTSTQRDGAGRAEKKSTGSTAAAAAAAATPVLRLPPMPAPLPACLQCVLAGTCCSLTVQPYAKAFVNDSVSTRQPRPVCRSPMLTASQLARLSTTADVGVGSRLSLPGVDLDVEVDTADDSADDLSDWELATSGLPWKRQHQEQRLLRKAIVRGSTDSPFLPQPPAQCARCERSGETACLQQSRDITNITSTTSLVSSSTAKQQRSVAWFASSGPPPLSLLPQHNVSLLDQIRFGPVEQCSLRGRATAQRMQQPGKRLRSQHQPQIEPRPVLEAVFCREPSVLTACEVASRAQILLEQIALRYPNGRSSTGSRNYLARHGYAAHQSTVVPFAEPGYLRDLRDLGPGGGATLDTRTSGHVRPATKLEVSRLLPRRGWMNVYAGRGVAVAAGVAYVTASTVSENATRAALAASDHYPAAVPPALPAWCTVQQDRSAAPPETRTQAANRRGKWQDYFLDVDEGRAAAEFQRGKEKEKGKRQVKRKPLATDPSHQHQRYPQQHSQQHPQESPIVPGALVARPETAAERQARIAQMVLSLERQFREKRYGRLVPRRVAPAAPRQRSPESETSMAELISTLTSGLDAEQAHRLATLLAGPVAAT